MFINLARSYIYNFIRNSLPHKHLSKDDKHIFVLILVVFLAVTPAASQTFRTNEKRTITNYAACLKITIKSQIDRNKPIFVPFFVISGNICIHVLMQLLMGFNVYLPTGKMVGNIEFYKDQSIEKVLYDIQRCVLLHATNLNNIFCKKVREKSTPLRHIQNLARLAALNRFLYSEKAPFQIFTESWIRLCIY